MHDRRSPLLAAGWLCFLFGGFAAALLTPARGLAGERVERTLPVAAAPLVRIEVPRGEVQIRGWDRDAVEVVGELDDGDGALTLEARDGKVLVAVRVAREGPLWGDATALSVRVPVGSRVGFEGPAADVLVRDVRGGVKLSTASGDIDVETSGPVVIARTASGDVAISNVDGEVRLASLSGDLRLEAERAQTRFSTLSGDVDIELAAIGILEGESKSGDVEVEGLLAPAASVTLRSLSGDVELELRRPVNATLEVVVNRGGEIINRLSEASPVPEAAHTLRLDDVVGDGSARIDVRTFSGRVRLR